MDFWVRAAQLILSLSLLIVLHEFGHFIPARLFKIRVEKFYLFFDPYFSLFKKKIGDTEWGIGWLPLGGYVKIAGMVDESMDKEQMALPPKPDEFRSKPAWQRLIVMIGGVTVNIIVGFLIYILLLAAYGEEKIDQNKLANGISVHPYMEQFGFRSGDIILAVDGKKPEQLQKLSADIMIFDKRDFKVKHQDGKVETILLPEDIGYNMFYNGADMAFNFRYRLKSVDSILPKSQASKMKLKKGDVILSLNGQPFGFYDEFTSALYHNKGKAVVMMVQRDGKQVELKGKTDKDGKLGFIPGLHKTKDLSSIYTVNYGFGECIGKGIKKGWNTLYMNVAQFKYVFTEKGASSVGGFGSIGKLFPTTWDWEAFWGLTAFISIALAFMNILPIPALDGGHVVFLLYEMITGRQPAQRVLEVAQYIGFFLIIGLVLYANGNDIIKAIFG